MEDERSFKPMAFHEYVLFGDGVSASKRAQNVVLGMCLHYSQLLDMINTTKEMFVNQPNSEAARDIYVGCLTHGTEIMKDIRMFLTRVLSKDFPDKITPMMSIKDLFMYASKMSEAKPDLFNKYNIDTMLKEPWIQEIIAERKLNGDEDRITEVQENIN